MFVIKRTSRRHSKLGEVCSNGTRSTSSPKIHPSYHDDDDQGKSACDFIENPELVPLNLTGNRSDRRTVILSVINLCYPMLLIALFQGCVVIQAEQPPQVRPPTEYQIVGQVNQEAHLPCLIGRQLYCGEPYFIAWYKLNTSSNSWVRIEQKSDDELGNDVGNNGNQQMTTVKPNGRHQQQQQHHHLSPGVGRPINERVHFIWARSQQQQQRGSWRPACDQPVGGRHGTSAKLEANFDCAQLTVGRLELMDEGQYKCEITFSESLDFDKCPATTLSLLSVIAHPKEPELMINGQPQPQQPSATDQPQSAFTFKEGSQVRLECLSSGGRPAPRIEWLNVSSSGQQDRALDSPLPEVQLMRSHWPQKKSTYLESSPNGTTQQTMREPVTSSSVTISLTRYDLNSHFVCLVLPHSAAVGASQHLEQLIKSPAYLAALLASGADQPQTGRPVPGLVGEKSGPQAKHPHYGPMFKWVKLNVLVKPTSVGLIVRDLDTDEPLEPVYRAQQQAASSAALRLPQASPAAGSENHQPKSPFYSLKPNKLYAIQCIVENSRPQSQVAWFNRSAPISLEARQLNETDFLLPAAVAADTSAGQLKRGGHHHRLSSFIRSIGHANGTFRSIATLLLTTNVWDNFEELYCRPLNEAFQQDELLQVAPIMAAKLYVNSPRLNWLINEPNAPFAWLEPIPTTDQMLDNSAKSSKPVEPMDSSSQLVTLSRDAGTELTLRCTLAANPLSQNTILQIEWLKDGRKLATQGGSGQAAAKSQQQPSQPRIHIEKANHLHMPASGHLQLNDLTASASNNNKPNLLTESAAGLGNQLVASSKLIGSSWLKISSLNRVDSGLYSCQYKLIPAPSVQLNANPGINPNHHQQQQQQIRITSGQANQSIQVNVIDAKPRSPTLRILSSSGLLVYGARQPAPPNGPGGKPRAGHQAPGTGHDGQADRPTVVIGQADASISLKCHLPAGQQARNPKAAGAMATELAHKIMWHRNGLPIHSSGPQDTSYNFTLNQLEGIALKPQIEEQRIGVFSCAHHVLVSAGSSPDNFHGSQMKVLPSANQIDLKLRVEPKLLTEAANKRELMPPVRSFSELELNANSGKRLRLVCMAQCEPICSIDWWLNRRPLGAAGNVSSAKSKWIQVQQEQVGNATNSQQNRAPLWLSRAIEVDPSNELGVGGLGQWENLEQNAGSGAFSWTKSASLAFGRAEPLEVVARKLRQESMEIQQQQLPLGGANVISKLELTYGQLARLLAQADGQQVTIKCKLNPMLNGQQGASMAPSEPTLTSDTLFGHALVEPLRWFPADEEMPNSDVIEMGDDGMGLMDAYDGQLKSISLSYEPLNLKEGSVQQQQQQLPGESELDSSIGNSVENSLAANLGPNHYNNINSKPMDLHARKMFSAGHQQQQQDDKRSTKQPSNLDSAIFGDEMQTSILLDRPPGGVSVSFAGIVSTDQEPSGVTIVEGQLIELMDPNKPAPLLQCQVANSAYPRPQFKWIFTDSNGSEHTLTSDGPQLDLRQFIGYRQRQLNVDLMSAYGAEVVASFVGNYTCTASNIHGSKSATLAIQTQGRPLCKLALGSEYLGAEHELLANLRCLVYSNPHLLETVWFRGNQHLDPINRSASAQDTQQISSASKISKSMSPITIVEFPIVVLNRQQEFLLMDPIGQLANFKCVARNSLGYSEACELSQADKLSLMNTFKPIPGSLNVKPSPAFPMDPMFSVKHQPSLGGNNVHGGSLNFIAPNNTIELGPSANQPIVKLGDRSLWDRSWSFVTIVCILTLLAWLLIMLIRCLIRRCYSQPGPRKFPSAKPHINHNTSWRFNPTRSNSHSETMASLPFHSKTICVNYYGGSNGDSEHDMMQSCSQSSHYEESTANGGQHQMQQQPPVYFNGGATLTRRTLLKSSLSTSSTGDSSSSGGRQAQHQHLLAGANGNRFSDKPLAGHLPSNKLASTMRESLAANIGNNNPYGTRQYQTNTDSNGSGLTLTSNVPLISGANNSRINLNQPQQYGRYQRQDHQQTFGARNEPIYDDVIYNQMIL